jgi:hypothetical protein
VLSSCAEKNLANSLSVICAVNDENVLSSNLLASPVIRDQGVPVYTYRDAKCMGEAYNAGIDESNTEFLAFIHQDVFLPRGWEQRVANAIDELEASGDAWGVLGSFGVTRRGQFAGTVWSAGSNCEFKFEVEHPVEVCSFDEVVLITRRTFGLRFDIQLPHFHLYGTDIALSAAQRGYSNYVIDAPIIHNCYQRMQLEKGYRDAFNYMCKKWPENLPIPTPICELSTNKLSLTRTRYRIAKRRFIGNIIGRRQPNQPISDPQSKARELGYERI